MNLRKPESGYDVSLWEVFTGRCFQFSLTSVQNQAYRREHYEVIKHNLNYIHVYFPQLKPQTPSENDAKLFAILYQLHIQISRKFLKCSASKGVLKQTSTPFTRKFNFKCMDTNSDVGNEEEASPFRTEQKWLFAF